MQSCRAPGGLGRVVEVKEGRVTGGVTAWRASRYGAGRELFVRSSQVATKDYISEVTSLEVWFSIVLALLTDKGISHDRFVRLVRNLARE